MPRWMFYAPLIALVAATAVIGLSLGRKAALRSDETEVIARVIGQYVEEGAPHARSTDCSARLATSEALWLVVTCAQTGDPALRRASVQYYIDRFGAVVHRAPPL